MIFYFEVNTNNALIMYFTIPFALHTFLIPSKILIFHGEGGEGYEHSYLPF